MLFVHASWTKVSKEAADELRKLGLPCPTENYNGYNVALPAAVDPVSIPAKAGSSNDPVVEGDDVVEEVPAGRNKIVRGSAEEARAVEHQMTRMPKNPHCEVCAMAKAQGKSKRKKAVAIDPDAIGLKIPEKLGAQVTADRLIKNDDGEEDDGGPVDTVAVVLPDRGTGWIDVYP